MVGLTSAQRRAELIAAVGAILGTAHDRFVRSRHDVERGRELLELCAPVCRERGCVRGETAGGRSLSVVIACGT